MNKIVINGKTIEYVKYSSETLAFSAAARSGSWVILGDDFEYWLVKLEDADRLIKVGYNFA